jgi:hypothetical protein
MPSEFKVSIGSTMLFIVVVALQMVLFEGVWHIVVIPWLTITLLTLNLALFFLLVRLPILERRIVGMLLAGVLACFAVGLYVSFAPDPGRGWMRAFRGRAVVPIGPIGRLVDGYLIDYITTMPDPQSTSHEILNFLYMNIYIIEFLVLDIVGVMMICAGGWLENRFRRQRVRPAP